MAAALFFGVQPGTVSGALPQERPDTLVLVRVNPDTIRPDTLRPTAFPPDTITPFPLTGVIVEILRSPMRLDESPFAVSVLAHELRWRGRSDSSIDEALQGLPGVQIQNRFNDAAGERVSIRGFGARSEFGVRGIRIFVDGIPATLPDGQSTLDHLDLGTLGRVEALRGPGSALYGNAAGGVLDFQTRAPPESPVRQELRVIQGDHGLRRRQSTTAGTFRGAGYLVSLSRYEWGGYRVVADADAGERYGETVRDHLNSYLTFPLFGGFGRLVVNGVDVDAEDPGGLTAPELAPGDRRASPLYMTQRAGKRMQQIQAGASWEGPVRDRELAIAVHTIRKRLDSPLPTSITDLEGRVGGFRAIVRSEQQSPMGRLWWAMGVESDFQVDDRTMHRNTAGARGPLLLDQRERVSAGAVFIQALLPIAPLLDVMTGLRYDRMIFTVSDRGPPAIGPDGQPIPRGSSSRTMDSASPSFGAHLSLHRALGLYANLGTAFETPTTSELSADPDGAAGFAADLDPQVGVTSEIGGRGILFPAAVWELTYFHTVLYNELVPFELEDEPGRRYYRNAERSRRAGWELALQFTPDPYVSARLVVSTNDARFRAFRVDDVDYAGRRLPGIAPSRVEGILRLGPGQWFAEVRGEALAAIPGNDENTREAESPAHRLVDVRAGGSEIPVLGLHVSPFFGVTNVFDVRYNTSVVVNAADGRHFEPGPGRSAYFGASVAIQR